MGNQCCLSSNVVSQVPSNVLLKRLRPHFWLSLLMVLWGIVMTVQGLVHDWGGLMGKCIQHLFISGLRVHLYPCSRSMVPRRSRSRSLPRRKLLPQLLVQTFRVRPSCSSVLLCSDGEWGFWWSSCRSVTLPNNDLRL